MTLHGSWYVRFLKALWRKGAYPCCECAACDEKFTTFYWQNYISNITLIILLWEIRQRKAKAISYMSWIILFWFLKRLFRCFLEQTSMWCFSLVYLFCEGYRRHYCQVCDQWTRIRKTWVPALPHPAVRPRASHLTFLDLRFET